MESFRTFAEPVKESFKMKVRLSEKQEVKVNIAAFAFMGVITLISIWINQL